MIGYILAIGAAATWSMVALSATRIVRYFGSYNYNLLRLIGIVVRFLPYIVVNWDPIYFNKSIFIAIFLSSVIGIIIASIVNIFLQSSAMQFVISCVGVLVFVGLTAYDTQRIKSTYYQVAGTAFAGKAAIMGALTLYLDFINLFIMLMQLFGQRR